MKRQLEADNKLAVQKLDEEEHVLKQVRNLNDFVFAVLAKEDKRVLCKYS